MRIHLHGNRRTPRPERVGDPGAGVAGGRAPRRQALRLLAAAVGLGALGQVAAPPPLAARAETFGELHVEGAAPSAGVGLAITNTAGRAYGLYAVGAGHGTLGNKPTVYDATAGVHRLVLDAAGNLGVGASPGGNRLHVEGTSAGSSVALGLRNTAGRGYALMAIGAGHATLANGLTLYDAAAGAHRLVVDAAGNVGVGAPAGGNRLHVEGTSADSAVGLGLHNTAGRGYALMAVGAGHPSLANKLTLYDATAGVHRLAVDASGNLGVGELAPSANLDVAGDLRASGELRTLAGVRVNNSLAIDGTGTAMQTYYAP